MRKFLCCSFIVLLGYWVTGLLQPVWASDSWQKLPANTCPSYPVISACNLSYILETNASLLGQSLLGQPGKPESVRTSAVGILSSGIDLLVKNPPASGKDFLVYTRGKFHVPGTSTPIYAADEGGIGYTKLAPVLKIWVVMRNLAYFVFAVIFIVIGIMILIRAKIDPKTTVDIQNALPKIILALILVTFSYAIAGFLIDIMYVALALIVTIFNSMGNVGQGKQLEQLLSGSIFEFITSGGWWDTTWVVSGTASRATDQILTPIVGGVAGSISGILVGGVAILVVGLAILWALFKTWLALISAYANFILGIIFAPLQLMVDAIPGQNQFEGWLRNMLACLMSFPAVVMMLAIGSAIATDFGRTTAINTIGFVPPLVGIGDQAAAQAFVGLGILLTIPKAVEILQKTLKAPEQKWGTAWGDAVGWSAGATSGPVRGMAYDELYRQGRAATWFAPLARGIAQAGYNRKWWGAPPPPP